MRELAQVYVRRLHSDDRVLREAARRQLARLIGGQPAPVRTPHSQSRWAHVPLGLLFGDQGNRIAMRSDGRIETGHEPMHGSRSGRCVLIDPTTGRWWCRSCRRTGDASRFVMDARGWPYAQAASWLEARYGPSRRRRRPSARPRWLEG